MIKLRELIEQLKIIRTETKSKISDEILFDNAVKIFISNRINESKNYGSFPFPKKESLLDNEKTTQATDSQKWKLKKLGYKGDLNKLNKLEAMKLIQENLK